MKPFGAGAAQMAFDALYKKLDAEGLFAPERKRPLPAVPPCMVGAGGLRFAGGGGRAAGPAAEPPKRAEPVCPPEAGGLRPVSRLLQGVEKGQGPTAPGERRYARHKPSCGY